MWHCFVQLVQSQLAQLSVSCCCTQALGQAQLWLQGGDRASNSEAFSSVMTPASWQYLLARFSAEHFARCQGTKVREDAGTMPCEDPSFVFPRASELLRERVAKMGERCPVPEATSPAGHSDARCPGPWLPLSCKEQNLTPA